MSPVARPLPLAGTAPVGPSRDGLALLLGGMVYLLAICLLQGVTVVGRLLHVPLPLPSNVMDVRDVVALFGWVGLMISGVSVIIVPNHLRVRLRPPRVPRVHLLLVNLGVIGFFVSSLIVPASSLSDAFLAVVSCSYLLFGASVLATVLPFVRERTAGKGVTPRVPRETLLAGPPAQ